jgi:hypothetical protein
MSSPSKKQRISESSCSAAETHPAAVLADNVVDIGSEEEHEPQKIDLNTCKTELELMLQVASVWRFPNNKFVERGRAYADCLIMEMTQLLSRIFNLIATHSENDSLVEEVMESVGAHYVEFTRIQPFYDGLVDDTEQDRVIARHASDP